MRPIYLGICIVGLVGGMTWIHYKQMNRPYVVIPFGSDSVYNVRGPKGYKEGDTVFCDSESIYMNGCEPLGCKQGVVLIEGTTDIKRLENGRILYYDESGIHQTDSLSADDALQFVDSIIKNK